MNISTQYSVIPAPGLPVIPAVGLLVIPATEPESEDNGRSQDSGTPDRCLRRNDSLQEVLF